MNDIQRVVERFHTLLVQEIRIQRPEYLNGPFTVAEIYQNLVPYATHRDRLGVEMNGDYEDALVRLLAGEGGFLQLDSEAALRELRDELDNPHPNTGIYREFAALDVRLSPEAALSGRWALGGEESAAGPEAPGAWRAGTPGGSGGLDPMDSVAGEVPAEVSGSEPAPADSGAAWPTVHADVGTGEAPDPSSDVTSAGGGSCRWCSGALPDRLNLRYCPHCGSDVSVAPCPQCGEELESTWRFCIACGVEVAP